MLKIFELKEEEWRIMNNSNLLITPQRSSPPHSTVLHCDWVSCEKCPWDIGPVKCRIGMDAVDWTTAALCYLLLLPGLLLPHLSRCFILSFFLFFFLRHHPKCNPNTSPQNTRMAEFWCLLTAKHGKEKWCFVLPSQYLIRWDRERDLVEIER